MSGFENVRKRSVRDKRNRREEIIFKDISIGNFDRVAFSALGASMRRR